MTVKLRRNWTLVTLMNVACSCASFGVYVCGVCVCGSVCVPASKCNQMEIVKESKNAKREFKAYAPLTPPSPQPSLLLSNPDGVTRQAACVHCLRFCTNYAENMFGHVAILRLGPCLSPCFSLDFPQIFSDFPPRCFFVWLQFESDPWSRGCCSRSKATSLLLYRLNSNPKHVPTQSPGLMVSPIAFLGWIFGMAIISLIFLGSSLAN